MHSTPVSVLLTRPAEAAARFENQVKQRLGDGAHFIHSPLIEIQALDAKIDLDAYNGVIFSSANGVRVATDLIGAKRKPAYCLGTATKAIASDLGWAATQCGTDAESLVEALPKQRPPTPLLHLHGVHTRGSIAEKLSQNGVPTQAMAIYDQPVKPLSDEAIALLIGGTSLIVPLFSPRSAAQFCEAAPYSKEAVLIAMSDAVAEALTEDWSAQVQTARAPTAKAMLDAIEKQVIRLSRVERQGAGQ